MVEKLWGWAKEELPFLELLMNKLLHGINAWQLAALSHGAETMGKLWGWAKELKLKPKELRNELFKKKGGGWKIRLELCSRRGLC